MGAPLGNQNAVKGKRWTQAIERAIDAFRSKDTDTGCQLLEQVAERAPAESAWRSKADTLFLKRCGR